MNDSTVSRTAVKISHAARQAEFDGAYPPFPKVVFSTHAMLELDRLVVEGFKAVPRRGAEVGGLLLGERTVAGYAVTECIAVEIEYRSGPSYTLSEGDMQKWETAVAGVDDGERLIGVFRSQTRPGMQPASDDSWLAEKTLPGRLGLFLLIKPRSVDTLVASYFLCEGGAIADEVNAPREIPFGTRTLSSPEAPPSSGSRVLTMPSSGSGQSERAEEIPTNPQVNATDDSNSTPLPEMRTKRIRLWLPVSAAATGIGLAIFFSMPHVDSPLSGKPATVATTPSPEPDQPIKTRSDTPASPSLSKPAASTDASSPSGDRAIGSQEGARTEIRSKRPAEHAQLRPRRPLPPVSGVKRFLRAVGSKATQIWPFRSSKTSEQNRQR